MKDQVNKPNQTLVGKPDTLEGLIENLDQRGVLILLVLLGQQAMKLLAEKHVAEVTKPNILKPT